MPDTYLYSDEQARAVHVSVQGIAQALDQRIKPRAPAELAYRVKAKAEQKAGQYTQSPFFAARIHLLTIPTCAGAENGIECTVRLFAMRLLGRMPAAQVIR